jgi:hypothetical protein
MTAVGGVSYSPAEHEAAERLAQEREEREKHMGYPDLNKHGKLDR